MPVKKSKNKKDPKKKSSNKKKKDASSKSTVEPKHASAPASKAKKKKKKKVTKKDRKEIKKAASVIPGLIVERATVPPKKESPSGHYPSAAARKHIRKKKQLLWVGVSILMLCILSLWYLNIRTLLYDVSRNDIADTAVIEQIREDYNAIVKQSPGLSEIEENADAQDEETVGDISEKIKAQLSSLFAAVQQASSTQNVATSTEEVISIFDAQETIESEQTPQ